MNLLIITQSVHKHDPVLGFFHGWIVALAKKYHQIHVICLYEGDHDLPMNVRVHSLGKESGVSRFKYITRFFNYVWNLRKEYSSVLVHMNQEYVLLGGWLWRMLGKKITLWRNHKIGSWKTNLAGKFAHTVCYTSSGSYTASFKNAIMMPVGIDENLFYTDSTIERNKNSFLYVGRISPIKNIKAMINGFIEMYIHHPDQEIMLTIVGPSDGDGDRVYKKQLQAMVATAGLDDNIVFLPAIAPTELASMYNRHEYCLNFTESGSFDKTIWESVFCGCVPIVYNTSFLDELPEKIRDVIQIKSLDVDHIDQVLQEVMNYEKNTLVKDLMEIGGRHSLKNLVEKLGTVL